MNWLKKLFRRKWPKRIRIEVRDGNCQLLDFTYYTINSWDEVIPYGEQFAQDVMSTYPAEELDEVYWHYEEEV